MRSITGLRRAMAIPVRRARPSHPDLYKVQEGARPEAPLSARFPAMLGAALQSGPASAPCAAQYGGVRPAVRASVIEGNDRRLLKMASRGRKPARLNPIFGKGTIMRNELVAVLLVCCLAACAQPPAPQQQAAPAPAPAAPPPEAAAPPPPRVTSEAQIAPGQWDVDRVRCSDLLGADDDDRAAAAMFYYGYLAAKAGIRVIDVSQVDGNVRKVMDRCAAAPNITVPQAFRQALGRR